LRSRFRSFSSRFCSFFSFLLSFSAGDAEGAEAPLALGEDVDAGVDVGEAGEVIGTIRRG
jgi:hypothetical protein